jgi:cytoskeleton protein RodZ
MPEPDSEIAADVSGLGLGERLRSARKARALSLEQVSETLHLDENIVLALEEERFDALGAAVFVRGHLRAYARLVGLPIDSVLDAYAKADPDNDRDSPVITRDKAEHAVSINPVMWGFWGMVALVGFALAAYVFQGDEPAPVVASPDVERVESAPPEPLADMDVDTSITVVEDSTLAQTEDLSDSSMPFAADEEVPTREIAAPELEFEPEPVIEVEPVIERPSQTVRLSLHFRQESWVEISDVNSRLLFGLQREGRRRELTAEPPVQLLIGNASGVDLTVNDEPYSVPMAGVTGKVARFEIAPSAGE